MVFTSNIVEIGMCHVLLSSFEVELYMSKGGTGRAGLGACVHAHRLRPIMCVPVGTIFTEWQ